MSGNARSLDCCSYVTGDVLEIVGFSVSGERIYESNGDLGYMRISLAGNSRSTDSGSPVPLN